MSHPPHLAEPHLSEDEMVLLYYGEPGAPADARRHLASCPECAAEAESVFATLDGFTDWKAAEPPAGFESRLWPNIEPHLQEPRPHFPRWKFFGVAAAFASLVIAAFIAGRLSTRPAEPAIAGLSREARDRVLQISVADHLDRAEILLTNLANGIPPDPARAADLVSEGRLLRSALARSGDAGTLALVDDVERFLVEAAHEPAHPTPAALTMLERRIEDDSLVFKIRIIESNLRTRGQKS